MLGHAGLKRGNAQIYHLIITNSSQTSAIISIAALPLCLVFSTKTAFQRKGEMLKIFHFVEGGKPFAHKPKIALKNRLARFSPHVLASA